MNLTEPGKWRSWRLGLGIVAVAGAWWGFSAQGPQIAPPETEGETPAKTLQPAPAPIEEARATAAPVAPVALKPGFEPRIDAGSLAPGEALEIQVSLPAEAANVGVEAIWVYADSHDPTQIQGRRTSPTRLDLELGPELLERGRHIVELRTDEVTPIPLRRYAFEIR